MSAQPTTSTATPSAIRWIPLPAPGLTIPQAGMVSHTATPESPLPCRRCLCDGLPGEEMLLVSYDPFLGNSPYRGASPIFVHARACDPWDGAGATGVPAQMKRRMLSLRAYDGGHMMTRGEVVQAGDAVETVAREMLGDGQVEYLHVHNAKPGCFAARVERA